MGHLIIDGHEDLAYNAITFNRNYLQGALETRAQEKNSSIPERGGQCMLGYPDWQAAGVAIIFGTLFAMPKRYQGGEWEKVTYRTPKEARIVNQIQLDYYLRLCGENPNHFSLLTKKNHLNDHLNSWDIDHSGNNPIGIILLMEGAEGLSNAQEIEEWYQSGLRICGPTWAGNTFCGGMYEGGRITSQGRLLLEIMADLKMGLDIAHMTEESALEAIDRYDGAILASHVTVRSLMKGRHGERLLTDQTIRKIAEKDGVIGIMPYNYFLDPEWTKSSRRDTVTLNHYINHIDTICQLTGSADHVAIGSDFDGTIGYPEVPLELNTIADLNKLDGFLVQRGYSSDQIGQILGKNWLRIINRILT